MPEDMDVSRVLLAVPAPALLAEYRTALVRAGYRVGLAIDGIQCLRRIREFRPDLLVLDVDLLWGGAEGVLGVIQDAASQPAPLVIAIGSRHNRGALYRVARFAVDDFQSKPLSGQQLVRRITDVIKSEREPMVESLAGGKRDERNI